MNIQKVSISDMFGWLLASFRLIGSNLGKFTLASLLSLLVIILLVVAIILVLFGAVGFSELSQPGYELDIKTQLYLYASIAIISILLLPPFIAGWLHLCSDLAAGRNCSATDIFSVYSTKLTWKKLIQYSFISLLLYVLVHIIYITICVLLGINYEDFVAMLSPKPGTDPMAILSLSSSFWFAYLGMILAGMFLQQMILLGFTQATLSDNNALQSLKAGLSGVLKNLVNFIIFFLLTLIAFLIVAVLFGIVIGLAVGAIALLNNTTVSLIGFAILFVLYIALILFIYPLMFSFNFFTWKGILGSAEPIITKDNEALI